MPDEIALKPESTIEPVPPITKHKKTEEDDWIQDENGDFPRRGDDD